jgi:chemotaxis protein MotB
MVVRAAGPKYNARMKGVTTLVLLVTLVFAGIAGYYFLEHRNRSDHLEASIDNIAQLREEIRDLEGQVGRLQAELGQAGRAVEAAKAEALHWRQEAAKTTESRARMEQQIREASTRLAAALPPKDPPPARAGALDGLDSALGPATAAGRLLLEKRGATRTITLQSRQLFGPGPADIRTEGRDLLREIARALAGDGKSAVRVEAHTDNVPIGPSFIKQFPSNLELSKARAEAVGRILNETNGIAPERVSAAGLGDTRPIGPNDSPEGRARNSRVEISVAP